MKASTIYNWQNKAIHAACAAIGMLYSENKAFWREVLEKPIGRNAKGLSDLSLGERDIFLDHLKTRYPNLKKPYVKKEFSLWRKGDPDLDTKGKHSKRPLTVPAAKERRSGKYTQ